MTKEQIELLLKDLCARLPYGVKAQYYGEEEECECVDVIDGIYPFDNEVSIGQYALKVEAIKPYLIPISSMTEEQWNNAPTVNLTDFTFEALKCGCFTIASYSCENELNNLIEFINWLIENHFDIYGLIPLGLAIDATFLNIY